MSGSATELPASGSRCSGPGLSASQAVNELELLVPNDASRVADERLRVAVAQALDAAVLDSG